MANTKAEPPALMKKEKKSITVRQVAIIIVALILIAILVVSYVGLNIVNVINSINNPPKKGPFPAPAINASLVDRDLLTYNSVSKYLPYTLIRYASYNVSNINANVSLLKYAPPSKIYLLDISNECFNCGNPSEIESALLNKLIKYNIIKNISDIQTLSLSGLASVPNDSLIIVLNGLLPSAFFDSAGTNLTVLDSLLNRHTSILYVGQSFSNMLLSDSVVTPASQNPGYLNTIPFSGNTLTKSGFYFNKPMFAFVNGSVYGGYLVYENIYNGSIAAFPNTPSSWQSVNQTGNDIARAVQLMFWLPKYAFGTRTVNTPNTRNSTGQFGVVMNATTVKGLRSPNVTTLNYTPNFASIANKNGYIRIVLTANAIYPYGSSASTYQYITAKPMLYNNGTLGIYGSIVTNQTVPLTFSIVTHSNALINIQPHLTIYTLNMTQILTTPLAFIHNVSNNFTFLLPYERLVLPPGQGYIIKLHSFYGAEYAGAFFNISPVVLYLVSSNITSDRFYFSVTSNKQPVTNLAYTMTLNNQYPRKGILKNGSIYYTVPDGTPTIRGNLNFTLNVSGSTFYYHTSYNPLPFTINRQYVELIVVVILMLVMIIFVRMPSRDEFYIDVPNLPVANRIPVKIKAKEMIDVFDRLNTSYRWKYMPLSKTEIRSAIANYIKYNNIPVSLTYSNIENILDQLTVKKYLVTEDNLYAPVQWVSSSKHDIEYLATFKKLRMYLVTHAYIFSDIDMSTDCDIVATLHNERKYIVIYSKTSRFQKVPVYTGSKTYVVFINAYKLEDFVSNLYESTTPESEEIKMYIAAGYIKLVDADNPNGLIS